MNWQCERTDERPQAALIAVALAAWLMAALLVFPGCGTEHYRRSADEEAYSLIDEKTDSVEDMPEDFSAEEPPTGMLEQIERVEDVRRPEETEPFVEGSAAEKAPRQINLRQSMELAAINSREFQDRRENVFVTALSLSLQRDRFTPRFSGIISGELSHDAADEEQASADSNFGVSRLLQTGGEISLDFSTVLSEYLTGDPREAASSLLDLTVTQPLLRGRGIAVTEPLTQAERNLVYELRRFVRFRRTFFTQVYSEYFDVLQQRQVVRNESLNLENLRRALDRAEAMFDAGRLPGFQVDQTQQDVLRAEDRLERAQQSYHRTLDSFKQTLGIKPDINLVLTMQELEQMQDARQPEMPWPRSRAVEIATSNRLDLQTARDQIADARRKVEVAVNDLKPGLDVTLQAGSSTTGNTQPVNFSGDNNDYSAGLELDLPLERTSERNRYRERLIDLDAARRAAERTRDQIIQAVREAWRSYFRAWESYRIQRNSVQLAQERVDSTTMLLEAGRASTRDMLEARESLIQAQNSLSQSLVQYRVARLELARNMDTLAFTDDYELEPRFESYAPSATEGSNPDE